ncbi:MAG TPA: 3-oxoacyl-ACP reductase FabG [Longimicrobiales bacterium]|nr:3-oxoacyl-ACP reductase FabG [Longimicrobiales bacterium]
MELDLGGTVALVTGAARGIGAAIARTLAAEGCDVALLDVRRGEEIAAVAADVESAGRRALVLEADVRDLARAEAMVSETRARLGRLDVLVCAAGITRDAMSWKMEGDAWDEVLAVNLTGCFAYARAAAPVLRAQRAGRMVFVASINGLRGKAGQANYAASKAGVIALAKTLARELGPAGINVNAVAPGLVETPMTRDLPAEALERAVGESALGRIGAAEDVADTVAFLCSRRARHITGGVIRIDGGQYM